MRSTYYFRARRRKSLKKNGRNADVIFFTLCQIGFNFRVSDREQAFQADRVERTIFVSSVWK
jgi:hypothetical protein